MYAKQRLADVFEIDGSGISDRAYSFALKAHLDFVVTTAEREPLFAVEFDGPGHDSHNDALKNELCERFELPLARIRQRHMHLKSRGLDAIAWLTHLQFALRELAEAQEKGIIPADEPLDPMSIGHASHLKGSFPLSLTLHAAAELQKLWIASRVPGYIPFHVAVANALGGSAIVALRVAAGAYVLAEESIYLSGFGISDAEAAAELAMLRLLDQVRSHLASNNVTVSADTVKARMDSLLADGEFREGGGGSDTELSLVHQQVNGRAVTVVMPTRGASR